MDALAAVANIRQVQAIFQALTVLAMTAYLFPPDAQLKDGDTFDYIVVGAGSAGSVVASRLTENKDVTVLLVEAGDDPPLESVLPAYMLYLKKTKWDWNYTSVPNWTQKCHKGEVTDMTRGKMLGGSSGSNYMGYVRGNPYDFNNWANIVNDQSWSYENVLPLFKKSEKLYDDRVLKSSTRKYHGTHGLLGVIRQSDKTTHKYLEAFKEIGNKIVLDTNGPDTLGYSEPMYTLANGVRQSTAYSFLGPAKYRSNLFVLKNTLATKIIFDKYNNAVGIETEDNNYKKQKFKATREVIISAGSINTPQLLMLSGIGPRNHLEELGIPVIANLPVGENLHDHAPISMVYPTEILRETQKPLNPHDVSGPQIIGYVAMNKTQTYPDYQAICQILDSNSALQICAFLFAFKDNICQKFYEESKRKEVLAVYISKLHPKSRGKILLRSRNPQEHPLINLNTFANKVDLEDYIEYMKDVHRITKSNYFRSVNVTLLVPPGCEGLVPESRDYWLCHAQCMVTTIYHYIGTCAMGSVVDSRLRVFGVQKLRVVDGSVMPTITSGNTYAPIIMIGEKAAEMIKKDNHS